MRHPAEVHSLELGDEPAAWQRLGFATTGRGVVPVGGIALACTGAGGGIRSWTLAGEAGPSSVDGLPTRWTPEPAREAARHPNGAGAIDHLVVFTGDRARTVAALEAVGGDPRRFAEPPAVPLRMAFVRLGEVVVEIAEAGGETRFWGLVVEVPDVDVLAEELGEAVGAPRAAVQPGRRIVTVRPARGLDTAVAFITPRRG